jgi:hypothetical protein
VRKLVEEQTHSAFVFAEGDNHIVYNGPGAGESMRLGVLTIVDQYDERYLMGHALCGGQEQSYTQCSQWRIHGKCQGSPDPSFVKTK